MIFFIFGVKFYFLEYFFEYFTFFSTFLSTFLRLLVTQNLPRLWRGDRTQYIQCIARTRLSSHVVTRDFGEGSSVSNTGLSNILVFSITLNFSFSGPEEAALTAKSFPVTFQKVLKQSDIPLGTKNTHQPKSSKIPVINNPNSVPSTERAFDK